MANTVDLLDPAFPGDDFDPAIESKYAGLSKIDYAMIHIMSGLAASGQYDHSDEGVLLMRRDAFTIAQAALSMSKTL